MSLYNRGVPRSDTVKTELKRLREEPDSRDPLQRSMWFTSDSRRAELDHVMQSAGWNELRSHDEHQYRIATEGGGDV